MTLHGPRAAAKALESIYEHQCPCPWWYPGKRCFARPTRGASPHRDCFSAGELKARIAEHCCRQSSEAMGSYRDAVYSWTTDVMVHDREAACACRMQAPATCKHPMPSAEARQLQPWDSATFGVPPCPEARVVPGPLHMSRMPLGLRIASIENQSCTVHGMRGAHLLSCSARPCSACSCRSSSATEA